MSNNDYGTPLEQEMEFGENEVLFTDGEIPSIELDEGLHEVSVESKESSPALTPRALSVNHCLSDSGFNDGPNLQCLESVLEWPPRRQSVYFSPEKMSSQGAMSEHSGFEDYIHEIYYHRLSVETKYHVPSCLENQPEVTAGLRGALVSWVTNLHHELYLRQDTLYLAVNIMDRVLDVMQVSQDCLQLLGLTSLLVASKQEEINPPEINDLLKRCGDDYTREQVRQLELIILMSTSFDLMPPTVQQFLEYYSSFCIANYDGPNAARLKEARALSRCVTEVSLQDYDMCRYRPSLLAMCVWKVAIAHVQACDGHYFPPGLDFTPKQYEKCLADVQNFMEDFIKTCSDLTSVCSHYMFIYSPEKN